MTRILFLFLSFLSFTVLASTTPEQQAKSITLPKAKAYSADDNHVVKIGVFYTQDLLNEFTIEEIIEYVNEQVNAANVVMENSGLAIRRELAYLGVHPIENDPNQRIEDFLSRIRGTEGNKNAAIAQQYGLDYVTVLRPMNDNRFCGWAYYADPFAILQMGGRCISNTLAAHEWGHNDGADHDVANSSATPFRAYGHGYFCGGEGTIMSSPSGNKWNTRHNFYSSPDLSASGDVCGEQNSANVVRMLNELKDNPFQMGNRKSDPEQLAFVRFSPEQNNVVEESSATIQVLLELVNAEGELITLGQPASIEVYTRQHTALASAFDVINDYQPFAQHITFQAGENTKQVNVALTADEISEADEIFSLLLRHGDIVSALTPEINITITEELVVEPVQQVSFANTAPLVLTVDQPIAINVQRTGDIDNEFTAQLAVSNDIATLSLTTLIFSAGQNEAIFNITAVEAGKGQSASLQLANSTEPLVALSSLSFYVLADEVVSFSKDTELNVNAGDTISLTLIRSGELSTAFDIEIKLSDSWMTTNNNTVHFEQEQTTQFINLVVSADSVGRSGTIELTLPVNNQGSIVQRRVNVADAIVVPPTNTNQTDTKSSSGGSSVFILFFMCIAWLLRGIAKK